MPGFKAPGGTRLEFTIDGDSSTDGSQTFTPPHTYAFRTLRLKHVARATLSFALDYFAGRFGSTSVSSCCCAFVRVRY